ncbi:DNA repair protein RecN [Phycicoccus sp. 3266]|uniref:DNA repair protein RecN n=1 Tax=Phycicoccus sp. 3266 TaxID=2817751 RepID=UPI00285EFD56|nr:DNA repair protein RecN [Phycicoccus sp. 3266]MDR6865252.1 DNA repair protein RecN (Recombination protein N) [Phycicoccus sp. 3266]
MLQELRIQRLGVIDDAVLDLHPGLNVVTGETGAGKTMVVTGLGLLLGARSDAGLVRSGEANAVVEGLVDVPVDHPAAVRAAEAGADVSEGLVLVRSVSAEGRSRAHVGGRSAPVGVLAEVGEHLVAVHGQADQWRLRQSDQHRAVLDTFGGAAVRSALEAYTTVYDEHEAAVRELAELRQQGRERAQEIEVLEHGLAQLEQLDPQPGEDADLRVEDERLSHAEGLRTASAQALVHLAGDEEYAAEPVPNAMAVVAAARQALAGEVEHDPALRELDRRLAEVGYLVGDLAADLSSYVTDVDVDPGRLAFVQQRRADLTALTRKYGDTIDDVLEWGRTAARRLDTLLGSDSRIEELEQLVEELSARRDAAATALTAARTEAAAALAEAVTAELAHLAMGSATIEVRVSPRAAGPARHGADDVEVMLAANPGAPARTVAKAASGGELSRVMLALEVVTGASGGVDVPTFVFDEVDAGVGGAAALDVGARLAALARHAQVVVVTHLPQVAAYADRHLVVRKANDGHITSSGVHAVEGEERLRELARMMAGVDTGTSLEHARELVEQTTLRRAAATS